MRPSIAAGYGSTCASIKSRLSHLTVGLGGCRFADDAAGTYPNSGARRRHCALLKLRSCPSLNMTKPSKSRARVVLLLLFTASPVTAQVAVATSGLNVRSGQSTKSKIKATLEAGDSVDLVAPTKRLGYYHVRTRETPAVTGWAWAARIRLVSEAPAPPAPSSVAAGVDSTWAKTASNATDINWPTGDHAMCQANGVGGDSATNHLKNRTDEPTSYHDVRWDSLAALPVPRNQLKHRVGDAHPWPAADLAAIAEYEGIPISVVGFLVNAKVEGKETTNCNQTDTARVDWHMYLTKGPHQTTRQSIVVETTPRVRPLHPMWNVDTLKAFAQHGDTVRISGWLMLDPEHWDQMWQYKGPSDTTGTKARLTLWEIHPITRIEVRRGGAWRSLDAP